MKEGIKAFIVMILLMVCAVLARRYKRQTEQLQARQDSRAAKA